MTTKGDRRQARAPVSQAVEFGEAYLLPDPHRPGGWTLYVDRVPQSYVDLGDPAHLEFEYMQRLGAAIDAAGPPGAPLRVLHLGAGALTLPRYVAATRPGSRQRVVERDAALVAFVRRMLPLPRGAQIRIRIGDARTAVAATGAARFDLVIGDVYGGAQMPRSVSSLPFATEVVRILRPGGLYAVNVADLPPLAYCRTQVATLRAAFGDVCLVADPGVLRGRRYGNAVLVCAPEPGGLPVASLAAAARRGPFPGRLVHGTDLDRFVSGARPVTDEAARDSPRPPPDFFG
ncbi:MAG TPA: fused MFS/spermidine synthase [Pilimelia sp.]|nr:fused MFS/spermidine synthase [Pilimelia sp.]